MFAGRYSGSFAARAYPCPEFECFSVARQCAAVLININVQSQSAPLTGPQIEPCTAPIRRPAQASPDHTGTAQKPPRQENRAGVSLSDCRALEHAFPPGRRKLELGQA